MISNAKNQLKTRERIKQTLVNAMMGKSEVMGCYESGSAAFNRADEWSDIDLGIVVKDGFVQEAVTLMEESMQKISPIEDSLILPQPTWHGHWQGFYKLKDCSPYLLLDVLIMQESSKSYFTEKEQHGNAIVFFDKTGKLGKEHTNRKELEEILPKRVERIRKISRFFHCFVDKEIFRKREIDAFDTYYNLILRNLIELLRIHYDPDRYSFGFRYLNTILPSSIYSEVSNLTYVTDLSDLQIKKDKAMNMLNTLLEKELSTI